MREIYLCWVDDVTGFVTSYNGKIELLQAEFGVKLIVDEHQNANNFDTIAGAIEDDLIFLIDYNLKGHDGAGMNGDEVIKLIRNRNEACIIVFYSSNATQSELRALVQGLPKVICVIRESLQEVLTDIAKGTLHLRLQ